MIQGVTMESSAVKAAKASSSAASVSSWATHAVATRTVQSPNITETDASTAVCRSVWLWACALNVSAVCDDLVNNASIEMYNQYNQSSIKNILAGKKTI